MGSLFKKVDLSLDERRARAWQSAQKKDYSKYGFGFADELFNALSDIGISKDDLQVIMILISVAQIFTVEEVRTWINDAIRHNELKDWLISDVLAEADTTFFDSETVGKIIKKLNEVDSVLLTEIYTKVSEQLRY